MTKSEAVTSQFAKAVKRLEEALAQKKDEFIRDSAIQRFEFTFDLSWKTIKAALEEKEGIKCSSPKSCFREAYKQKIIEYDEYWLELTDLRNLTSNTYLEAIAKKVYAQLPEAMKKFKKLLSALRKL